jgi:hypothetical protein
MMCEVTTHDEAPIWLRVIDEQDDAIFCALATRVLLAAEEHDVVAWSRTWSGRVDATWIGQRTLARDPKLLDEEPGPIIVFGGQDAASLCEARAHILHPKVVCWLKGSDYVDPATYNAWHTDGLYHARMNNGRPSERAIRPHPELPVAALCKVDVLCGFGRFERLRPLVEQAPDLNAGRTWDLHLACWTHYVCPEIARHRSRAFAEAGRLVGFGDVTACIGGSGADRRPFDEGVYRETLLRSRACLSPWGWGEYTIRDYEAILAGCVLIKPHTDFARTWPELEPEVHYIPCACDFRDLHACLARVRAGWPWDWVEWRARARAHVLQAWDDAVLAARLGAILRRRLHRP